MIEFLQKYWMLIIMVILTTWNVISMFVSFSKLPRNDQIAKVKEWLLAAVVEAEQIFGGGTGKIKLSYVYDLFVGKFPWFAKTLSFETFSSLVDGALEDLKHILETNKNVAALINKTE